MSGAAHDKPSVTRTGGDGAITPPAENSPGAAATTPAAPASPVILLVLPAQASPVAGPASDLTGLYLASPGVQIARRREGAVVTLGAHLEWAADRIGIVSHRRGRIHVTGNQLWVADTTEIAGNVDPSAPPLDVEGDVIVNGTLVDLTELTCRGSLWVGGVIEAAEVNAGGRLCAVGGIAGKEKGRCTAGLDVTAKYANNVTLTAGGDVLIDAEATNATIVCGGRLTIASGALLSGTVTATGGVECRILGSGAVGAALVVEAGIDQALREVAALIPGVEQRKAQAQSVRSKVEPLLRFGRNLTNMQREQATELLYQADELNATATATIATIQKRLQRFRAMSKPEVIVHETLHPGVTVRFYGVEFESTEVIEGPVRLSVAGSVRDRTLTCTDLKTGETRPLRSKPYLDPALPALAKLMQKYPPAADRPAAPKTAA